MLLAAALAAAGFQAQPPVPNSPPTATPAAEQAIPDQPVSEPPAPQLVLPKGTMVRLMVTKEVNSRDNHPGDRFVLRVDEDVQVHGVTLIPVGSKGWAEIVDSEKSGGVGRSGKINARLLYVDVDGRHVDLEGDRQSSGSGGTGQVVASVLAFGPLGLLMKGNNAVLKAGEILNGYTVSDTILGSSAGTP